MKRYFEPKVPITNKELYDMVGKIPIEKFHELNMNIGAWGSDTYMLKVPCISRNIFCTNRKVLPPIYFHEENDANVSEVKRVLECLLKMDLEEVTYLSEDELKQFREDNEREKTIRRGHAV